MIIGVRHFILFSSERIAAMHRWLIRSCRKVSTRRFPRELLVVCSIIFLPGVGMASTTNVAAIEVTSSAFEQGGEIPEIYSCEGKDISPPLRWSGVPDEADSLVLIVDDPDAPDPAAPKMTWVHWLVYNLPAQLTALDSGTLSIDLPAGAEEGINNWNRKLFGGPCPPIGRHRYFFKVYALDLALDGLKAPDKKAMLAAMQGHIIGYGELMGTYQKKR